jgi:hypothetical protein
MRFGDMTPEQQKAAVTLAGKVLSAELAQNAKPLGDALSQAYADYQTSCMCESSYCPSHAPAPRPGRMSPYCPNPVQSDSPRMVYVGCICVSCAQAVAAHDGSAYVTAPYGTWDGE